jgi:hypothetical protein
LLLGISASWQLSAIGVDGVDRNAGGAAPASTLDAAMKTIKTRQDIWRNFLTFTFTTLSAYPHQKPGTLTTR